MTTLYVAEPAALLVLDDRGGRWERRPRLEGESPRCVAVDPLRPGRVWCGAESGLWRSDDAGGPWHGATGPLASAHVSAVAVSPTEPGVVYAGTDPTRLYRSEDGGASWEELCALLELPSAPAWSFPPRPDTSHVRWITPDPLAAGRVSVCIEAGALVRSRDGGRTWADRVPDGPRDTHTLLAHRSAPGRLYSAAGDGYGRPGRGYGESRDGGDTWQRPDEGLDRHYLWGAAVDAGDPDTVLVSAAPSPRAAHSGEAGDGCVYRRAGGGPWRRVEAGLPEPRGTTAPVLAAHPLRPGVFYAGCNRGLFHSEDAGERWEPLGPPWPEEHPHRGPAALVVAA